MLVARGAPQRGLVGVDEAASHAAQRRLPTPLLPVHRQDRERPAGAQCGQQPRHEQHPRVVIGQVQQRTQLVHGASRDGFRQRQHPAPADELDGAARIDHLPAVLADANRTRFLIAEVEPDETVMLGESHRDGMLRPVKYRFARDGVYGVLQHL
jgi:hypothetical protein